MKHFFIFIVVALTAIGCTSEFIQFQDQALAFASDSKIDKTEYETLVDLIQDSNEAGFQRLKSEDGKIDNTKVLEYLVKYFTAKKVSISADDIYQPESADIATEKFNINVFLENSGSMNGYLDDPHTAFKNSVYSLLTRLQLLDNKDSLNLFLVNQTTQSLFPNASNNDLEKFKDILNPTSFNKISNGKTGTSDLGELIKRSLLETDENNMSVFISDCIYSPGKNVPDAARYLAEKKQQVFLNFATVLKNRPLSVVILQLFGNFKGIYYDRFNNKINIANSISRPYYIWFIGSPNHIQAIIRSKKLEDIDGGYANKLVLETISEVTKPSIKVLSQATFGTFDRTEISKNIITGASVESSGSNKGLFGFELAVNFSNSLQDPKYFCDTSNYRIRNKNYHFTIIENVKSDNGLNGFTHIFNLSTSVLKQEETLTIDLVGKTPDWVKASTSIDDSRMDTDESEKQKTFGFEFLVEGVCDAFYPKSSSNVISSISITIKK